MRRSKTEKSVVYKGTACTLLGVVSLLIALFTILSVFEYFMPFSRYAVIGLSILLVFQYILGIVIFNRLDKRL